MAIARRKLLIVADDHPRVREALEYVLSQLHDSVTLYTADTPDLLRPLAEKQLASASDVTFIDVSVSDPDVDAVHAADPSVGPEPESGDGAPLMVISMREQGVTAHWFAAIDTTDGEHDGSHIQAALDQRKIVMDLIQSLALAANRPGAGPSVVSNEPPDIEGLMKLGLTHRQAEVLLRLAQGLTNKEIARQLGVSEWTVRNHVSAILERLDVSNRGRAAMFARSLGGV